MVFAGLFKAIAGIGRSAGAAARAGGRQAQMAARRAGVTTRRAIRNAMKATGFTPGRSPRATSGARAAKPQLDYGSMFRQMGNPQAYQEAERRAANRPASAGQPQSGPGTRSSAPAGGNWMRFIKQSMGGNFNTGQLSNMPDLGDTLKDLGHLALSATGVSDSMDGFQKLLGGDVSGAMKSFATAGLKATAMIVMLPPAIRRWTESLVESRRQLAYFSGRATAAFAGLDAQRITLGMRTSRDTSTSTVRLVKALQQLNDASQPLQAGTITVINSVATGVAKFTTANLQLLNMIKEFTLIPYILRQIEGNTAKEEDQEIPAFDLLRQMQQPGFGGRPPLPPVV